MNQSSYLFHTFPNYFDIISASVTSQILNLICVWPRIIN